ncbi:SIS domain-containing protein [Hamadaea tsunoensis]|uniref:SIS domain-containing protein n=1 Tax=Hamadaea tsunoensis TaxID=53368 RepID=UPI0004185BE3|nr:sugar isomerase [Hamadaea tsunoensis]
MNVTATEIASQPETWARALADTALVDAARAHLAAPGERVLAIGCGTSWFVAEAYAALREAAGLGETDAVCASEVTAYRRYDRVIAFSRSGTTTEVLDALAKLPADLRVTSVVAVADTPIAERSDDVLLLDFADEKSVVQTRFPTTVLTLVRAAFDSPHKSEDGQAALDRDLPADPADIDHIVFLGTGWTVGLAHEAALKVREAAQAWSESYPAMDFRHGPMAVAGPRSLVWVFGPLPDGMAETVAATGARLHHDDLDPLAGLVLAQRFATALAALRGLNPDEPRLLTRSVILNRPAVLPRE